MGLFYNKCFGTEETPPPPPPHWEKLPNYFVFFLWSPPWVDLGPIKTVVCKLSVMLKQSFQGKVQVTTYLQEHLPEESRSDKSSWQIPANRSRVMKRKLLNTSDALNLQFQSSKNLGSSSWENGYQCSLHCIVWPLLLSFVNGFRGWYNTTFHRPLDTRSAGFPTPTPLHPH